MLTEDICAMTLIKLVTILFFSFILNSCESLKEAAGLTKPTMENDSDLAELTPDLVLPPEFGKKASKRNFSMCYFVFSVATETACRSHADLLRKCSCAT